MMINDQKELVFFHIPKNGGTSVRTELGKHGFISPFKPDFLEYENVTIDAKHQTPQEIRERFPELAARIYGYRQMIILRNPEQRFLSSVSQYLKMYSEKLPTTYSAQELHKTVTRVLDRLEAGEISLELTHFRRQADYLSPADPQILLDIDNVPALDANFNDLLGADLSLAKRNSRRFIRNRCTRIVKKNLDPIFRSLPIPVRNDVKRVLGPIFYQKRLSTDVLIRDDTALWARVARYYAKDRELFDQIT